MARKPDATARGPVKRKLRSHKDDQSERDGSAGRPETFVVTYDSSDGAAPYQPPSETPSFEILETPPAKRARKSAKKQGKNGKPEPAADQPEFLTRATVHIVIPDVLAIVPDICPTFLFELVQKRLGPDIRKSDGVTRQEFTARVIESLFEDGASFKKAKKEERGKLPAEYWKLAGKSAGGGSSSKVSQEQEQQAEPAVDNDSYLSVEWNAEERSGPDYERDAIGEIENYFLMVPVTFIRTCFAEQEKRFAPTFLALINYAAMAPGVRPYSQLKSARIPKVLEAKAKKTKKGRARQRRGSMSTSLTGEGEEPSAAFVAEKAWLIDWLFKKGDNDSVEVAERLQGSDGAVAAECDCCFGEYGQRSMLECTEGHLFCRTCISSLIKTCLGDQRAPATCMHMDGCDATFSASELAKCIEDKTSRAYHKLCQRKELQEAAIEGLEGCPECNYAVIVENPDEKLFYCQAEDCGVISCRTCRQAEHLPYTCDQAKADRKLGKRHAVEEAMTEALVRKCPKCQKAFLKEEGCNKITCTGCFAVSCYICRKLVTNGYGHFSENRGEFSSQESTSSKCPLWDYQASAARQKEVEEARRIAQERILEEARRDGIQLAEEDVRVDLPAPKANNVAAGGVYRGFYAPPQPQPRPPVQVRPPAPARADEVLRQHEEQLRAQIEARAQEEMRQIFAAHVGQARAERRAQMDAANQQPGVVQGQQGIPGAFGAAQGPAPVANAYGDPVLQQFARNLPALPPQPAYRPALPPMQAPEQGVRQLPAGPPAPQVPLGLRHLFMFPPRPGPPGAPPRNVERNMAGRGDAPRRSRRLIGEPAGAPV